MIYTKVDRNSLMNNLDLRYVSPIANYPRYAPLNEKSLEVKEVFEEQKIERSFYEPDDALDLSFADKSGHLNIEGESNLVSASQAFQQGLPLLSQDETDMSEANAELKDEVHEMEGFRMASPQISMLMQSLPVNDAANAA
jgi:hypothetical protein